MGDYDKNPKRPYKKKIPNKVRKRMSGAGHATRMSFMRPKKKLSELGAAITRKFYDRKSTKVQS